MLVTGALKEMTTKAACTSLFSPAQTLTNAPKNTQIGKLRWNSADHFATRAKKDHGGPPAPLILAAHHFLAPALKVHGITKRLVILKMQGTSAFIPAGQPE